MTAQEWGVVAALLGAVGNLIWNLINYCSNQNTRKATARLSDFNSNVRAPLIEALTSLDGINDEADDIVRSAQNLVEKVSATSALSKKFHSSRRILARRLNDCDTSELVIGDDWSRCDEGHMDEATAAFDDALRAPTDAELREKLHSAAVSIYTLRRELRKKLDSEAKRLMA